MEETVIETFDDVKFIEGVTKMNQVNWQEFFRNGFHNGIYDGLEVTVGDAPYSISKITDGTAIVNGLCVTIKTEDGYTEFPEQSLTDRFFCLRVNCSEGTAKLIMKTNISSDGTYDSFITEMGKFIVDESYCCERNDIIYELPLMYAGYSDVEYPLSNNFKYGINLRRMFNQEKDITWHDSSWALVSGKRHYYLDMSGLYEYKIYAWLDLVDLADGATIHITGGSSIHSFGVLKYPLHQLGTMLRPASTVSPVDFEFYTTSNLWADNSADSSIPASLMYTGFSNEKTTLTLKIHFLGYTAPHGYTKAKYRFFLEELA